jgi:pseudouridine synthase
VEDMRLQRWLSRRGLGSRRSCEELIRQGRVTINGEVATLGASVGPADQVAVNGKTPGAPLRPAYLLLHKPPGVIVSRRDTRGRPTVQAFLPPHLRSVVFPVGRLDQDSEGLLFFTNDGDLANSLLHPRYGLRRTYLAWVSGNVAPNVPAQLLRGVQLDDGTAAAAGVRWVKRWAGGGLLQVTLAEGRKREVRRMCTALGLQVARLKRVSFGPLRLGDLPPGQLRPLTRGEIAALRNAAIQGNATPGPATRVDAGPSPAAQPASPATSSPKPARRTRR